MQRVLRLREVSVALIGCSPKSTRSSKSPGSSESSSVTLPGSRLDGEWLASRSLRRGRLMPLPGGGLRRAASVPSQVSRFSGTLTPFFAKDAQQRRPAFRRRKIRAAVEVEPGRVQGRSHRSGGHDHDARHSIDGLPGITKSDRPNRLQGASPSRQPRSRTSEWTDLNIRIAPSSPVGSKGSRS